jgi:hypothetical protein
MQRSKLLLGSVVTLAVLGLGAGAVALEGSSGDTGTVGDETTTTVDPSTTTTAAPTTTVAPAPDTGISVDDPTGEPTGEEGTGEGVERSTEGCDGGTYANHGEYVSGVAHDPDREPGDVADAAHSDCGKPLGAVGGEDEVPAPEVPGAAVPDDARPGNGNGNGNGNGGGKPAR